MSTWRNAWLGSTVVCLASGPSLTDSDIELVHAWWLAASNRRVVACNTTFRKALWADAVVAHDPNWWSLHHAEFLATFAGSGVSWIPIPTLANVHRFDRRVLDPFQNSGAGAISFSTYAGASRILLLGYDGARDKEGNLHHHGDHPAPLSNGASIASWPRRFRLASAYAHAEGVRVVNCTLDTIVDCFEFGTLEEQLC